MSSWNAITRFQNYNERCQLGNAASLAWHGKSGFQEIPNYFAATHRWRHFAWLSDHFDHAQQPDKAAEMRQLADHWKSVVKSIEESDERWSTGLLDGIFHDKTHASIVLSGAWQ